MAFYAVKALGSMRGHKFEGWVHPETWDLIRSVEAPEEISLSAAEKLKGAMRNWAKSLNGISLEFFLVPLGVPQPRRLAMVRPSGRRRAA